jgi:hypothetical protein
MFMAQCLTPSSVLMIRRTLQNRQSELLAVALMAVLAIYLRQRDRRRANRA